MMVGIKIMYENLLKITDNINLFLYLENRQLEMYMYMKRVYKHTINIETRSPDSDFKCYDCTDIQYFLSDIEH